MYKTRNKILDEPSDVGSRLKKSRPRDRGQALRRTCWLNDGYFHLPLIEAAEQLQLFLIPTQQKQEGMDDGDGGPRFLTLIAWKVTRVQEKQKHLANTWGKKTGGAEKYVKDTIIPSPRVQWEYLPLRTWLSMVPRLGRAREIAP